MSVVAASVCAAPSVVGAACSPGEGPPLPIPRRALAASVSIAGSTPAGSSRSPPAGSASPAASAPSAFEPASADPAPPINALYRLFSPARVRWIRITARNMRRSARLPTHRSSSSVGTTLGHSRCGRTGTDKAAVCLGNTSGSTPPKRTPRGTKTFGGAMSLIQASATPIAKLATQRRLQRLTRIRDVLSRSSASLRLEELRGRASRTAASWIGG